MESKLSISPHMIKRISDTTKMVSSVKNPSVYSANNRMAMNSPSPPPQSIITAAAAVVAQQNINSSIAQQPKPNQVGTVLLYGIPIVSLYIEAQERLCLAQISNTLLKQFSYNEIHNRRVALGITCVQCTPVQLEILRRAGAMPVSSRRCGMITRREAERLCKSFLGDNAPPRLPDDFAFNVLHECAWGCRGSFLPSRYNSSRAKCIKCYYCGLFFSPNKFIFHSHRIGPNDKYIQPDAANFNSWRRHMKLSGTPDDFIIHSWEDVKAMFNGGTRKRLMVQTPISRAPAPSSPKKIKESSTMSPPLISTSATAVKTQNSVHLPIRPVNVHKSVSNAPQPAQAGNNNNPIRNVLPPAFQADLPLPFSRSFMMDYMWHQHQNPHKAATAGAASLIQFPTYALPWLKRPTSGASNLLFPGQHAATEQPTNNGNNSPLPAHTNLDGSKQLNFYNNSSAFKPVLSLRKDEETVKSVNKNNHHDHRQMKHYSEMSDDDTTDDRGLKVNKSCSVFKESLSSDDEMVDIETTDDDYCEPTTTSAVIGMRVESPMHSNSSNGQTDAFCRMTDSPVSTSIRCVEEKNSCCNEDDKSVRKQETHCNDYHEEIDQETESIKTVNTSPIINLSSLTSSDISSLSSTSPSSTVSSSSSIVNSKNYNNNNKSIFNNNNIANSNNVPLSVTSNLTSTTVSGQLWSVANLTQEHHQHHRMPPVENDENNSFGMLNLNARCLSAANFYRHHHSPPLSESFLLKNFPTSLQQRHSDSHSPPASQTQPSPNQQTYI